MNKVILVPDSFKGTMSASEVCTIMKEEILKKFPSCEVKSFPIADGGEGTVDCFIKYFGFKRVDCRTVNHQNKKIDTYYAFRGKEVVIEMAMSAGITLTNDLRPYNASTYGVGLMILDAIKRLHPKKIILTLGGSATNDLGLGMMSALGVDFYSNGVRINPTPLNIESITSYNTSICDDMIHGIEFICMTDVTNPLCGDMGATYVFGPQKGIKKDDLARIDAGLKHFSKMTADKLKVDYSLLPGTGAAGGMGFACKLFLHAKLKPGIDTILDMVSFNKEISDADYVFTGEGRLDSQSADGKAISGIAKRCKKQNKRLIALCGLFQGDNRIYDLGVTEVHVINKPGTAIDVAKKNAKANLREAMKSILEKIE